MIRSPGCPRLRPQPWTPDTRDLRAHSGSRRRRPARGVRELAGMARSSTATRAGQSEMHHSRPPPLPRGVTTGTPAGGPALSRAAVWWVAGWEDDRSRGGAARCSPCPPGPVDEHVPFSARRLSAAHRGVEERDHRIVAQAPGSDGLVENRRAPASGTASRPATVFGSSPNATRLPTEGPTRAEGTRPGARGRGAGVQVWGVGDGAPKPNVRDPAATPGAREKPGTAFRGTQPDP
jgi:hypothetical protein